MTVFFVFKISRVMQKSEYSWTLEWQEKSKDPYRDPCRLCQAELFLGFRLVANIVSATRRTTPQDGHPSR